MPPPYPNLDPDDPAEPMRLPRRWLEESVGRWYVCDAMGARVLASGRFIYVVQGGQRLVTERNGRVDGRPVSHVDLVGGDDVDYAGEISFRPPGTIESWDNKSGHYRPLYEHWAEAELPYGDFNGK